MKASKELDQSGGRASVDSRRNTSAVPRPTARALYRRWPVVALLPVLILVGAPFVCADGITFNGFDGKDFVSVPANVFTVSSSDLNFAVSAGGYFTSLTSSQTIAASSNPTFGPIAPTAGITPPGGPALNVTTIPTGGPSVNVTTVPEPASLWLVGIGLAILGFWSHRKRIADRHV